MLFERERERERDRLTKGSPNLCPAGGDVDVHDPTIRASWPQPTKDIFQTGREDRTSETLVNLIVPGYSLIDTTLREISIQKTQLLTGKPL